ncbi:MAG: aspartate/glutamate racemase family protein [Chloroflexi bacterium]|nr:aspartate/glutamate racemase family protein [Chloroflexota bacterium]
MRDCPGNGSRQGIEAIILGCTELPLALSSETVGMPALDTTRIQSEAAWNFARS